MAYMAGISILLIGWEDDKWNDYGPWDPTAWHAGDAHWTVGFRPTWRCE